jgi:hypothetical protein
VRHVTSSFLWPDLFQDIPEDRRTCQDLMAILPVPDVGALLANVSDEDLLLVFRLSPLRQAVVDDLHAIGVTCPNRKLPRSARMLRLRLSQSLPSGYKGVRLLRSATEPVTRLLVARAVDAPLSSLGNVDRRLETSPLVNLAVAVSIKSGQSTLMAIIALLKTGNNEQLEAFLGADGTVAVREAAERITEHGWTKFHSWAQKRLDFATSGTGGGHDTDDHGEPDGVILDGEADEAAAEATNSSPDNRITLADMEDRGLEISEGEPLPTGIEGLTALIDSCETRLPDAAEAARRVALRLESGRPPLDQDLDLVLNISTSLSEVMRQSCVLLQSSFDNSIDLDLESVRRLLHEADSSRAELLELMTVVPTTEGLDDAVVSLTQHVARIINQSPPHSPDDIALAEALEELHNLIRARNTHEISEDDAIDRSQELLISLPRTLRKVVLAAALGQVSFDVPTGSDITGDTTATAAATDVDQLRADSADHDGEPESESATFAGLGESTGLEVDASSTLQSVKETRDMPTVGNHALAGALAVGSDGGGTQEERQDDIDADLDGPQALKVSDAAAGLSAAVAAAVRVALTQGRTALAHHILRQLPNQQGLADIFHVVTLAQHSRTPTGPCALELVELCEAIDADMLSTYGSQIISAASLAKVALMTGDPRMGQLVADLADRLPTTWSKLAQLTAATVQSGVILAERLDATQHARASLDAANIAAERVEISAQMRGQRERLILNRLRDRDSDIGKALRAAAANDVASVDTARHLASDLTRGQARRLVISTDRQVGPSGNTLSNNLIEEVADIVMADRDAIARWASAASSHVITAGADNGDWGPARRAEALTLLDNSNFELQNELKDLGSCGPVQAGQASLAAELLEDITHLIRGDTRPLDPEESIQQAMSSELLKVRGATVDDDSGAVTLPSLSEDEMLAELLAAVAETSWEPALERHVADANFSAAKRCASFLDRELGEDSRNLDDVNRRHEQRQRELREQAQELRLLLVRARRPGNQSSEDSVDASLAEIEFVLNRPQRDLRPVREKLGILTDRMEALQKQTADDLRHRLVNLNLPEAEQDRIDDEISRGEFDEAEDEISQLQLGRPLPSYSYPRDLEQFFPAVPDSMPRGIDSGVLETIRQGGSIGCLDFSAVGSRSESIADVLSKWSQQGKVLRLGGKGWQRDEARDLLLPAFNGVGINIRGTELKDPGGPSDWGSGWRFVSVRDVTPIGKALVPAFGSQANHQYRLLLVYNKPDVRTLDSLRQADGSNTPLVICYFGTLSSADRLELARLWSDPTIRPTIVLDDAALTYVITTQGRLSGSLFASLMSITLPFTATAPFSAEKRPIVPIEMFYGRDREQREIESMTGASLIYGGRGMGKSALLSRIKEQADTTPGAERKAVLVELPRDEAFAEPETIWAAIADDLERAGLTVGRSGARGNKQSVVERMVDTWLDDHPHEQLLIMLDEVDGFFNADAVGGFKQTTNLFRLKDLRPRCKVVFSGLHSVNLFHGTGNVPFSPAGALEIGPLDPADAYRLLTAPFHAMGYAIEPKQSHQILMHCNYQPYLIQLFAHQLLELLHSQRSALRTSPPWGVTDKDIRRVMSDPALRDKIFRAFKLTLDLDKRFFVIVNLLARHAYSGRSAPLTDLELLAECKSTWPAGFNDTPIASFRELQNELEGLGILSRQDNSGRRQLRTSALLASLGSPADIEQNLTEVSAVALPESRARGLIRPPIDDRGRPAPLTSEQLATLAGRKGNRVNVLIGSPALGLDLTTAALQGRLQGRPPTLRRIEVAHDGGQFRKLLKTGEEGETRMTVVSELWHKAPQREACQEALENARSEDFLPENRLASRAVVLVAGPSNAEWLAKDLYHDPQRNELVVTLDRFTARTLPLQWRDQPKLEELGSPEFAASVLQVTGGWPSLVDFVAQRTWKLNVAAALEELEEQQKSSSWPGQFLRETGAVGVMKNLELLVAAMADYGGACTADDLEELGLNRGIDDVGRALNFARWFAIVDEDADQILRLAPLLEECWKRYETTSG